MAQEFNCTKCGREILPGEGFYNRPSGVFCSEHGDISDSVREAINKEKARKFLESKEKQEVKEYFLTRQELIDLLAEFVNK